jgi:DNA-binding response OmpR family regulator
MDDSAFILVAIRDALADVDVDVDTAEDLAEFERRCAERHDLILIDVQMPEVFGDDVATLLRQKRGVMTKIFFLSSLSDDDLQNRVAQAEVDGFISKRRGIETVVRRVQEILASPAGPAS